MKPFLAKITWLLAVLSLIGAWESGGGIWWGWDGLTWYWNALALGVLALGLKMSKYHDCWHKNSSCGCGKCDDGKCGMDGDHVK